MSTNSRAQCHILRPYNSQQSWCFDISSVAGQPISRKCGWPFRSLQHSPVHHRAALRSAPLKLSFGTLMFRLLASEWDRSTTVSSASAALLWLLIPAAGLATEASCPASASSLRSALCKLGKEFVRGHRTRKPECQGTWTEVSRSESTTTPA